jgi:hypothetical protein
MLFRAEIDPLPCPHWAIELTNCRTKEPNLCILIETLLEIALNIQPYEGRNDLVHMDNVKTII